MNHYLGKILRLLLSAQAGLSDLDTAGEQHDHLPNRIALAEECLLAPEPLFASSGNNTLAIGRLDVLKQLKSLN